MPNIKISHCANLIVKIFVIGYSQKGESIIIAFLDKKSDNVLYTIVIDSFTYKKINKTTDILNQYNISTIDMLCWSHPDYDHTKGIDELINNFCNESSKIITPYGLNGKLYDVIDYNQSDIPIVNKIIELNKRKKNVHLTSSVTPSLYQPMEVVRFSDYPDNIDVKIHTLTPHSSFINDRIGNDKTIRKNELSIAMYIEVEKYKFIFCSDIENIAISNIMQSCFDNPVLIKIPHHTSTSSDELLNISNLEQKNTLACTTIYKQHKLPNIELLDKYKSLCSLVHSTGTSKSKSKNFGVIEYTFDLYDKATVSIKCHGHATPA